MIREVGPDDWQDWRFLRQRSLTENPEAFSSSTQMWTGANDTEQRWRDRLAADGACLIHDEDGVPVGMVGAMPEPAGVQLISMWVAPEARGRGVGGALIREVIAWAGARPLRLRIMDGNDSARRVYESAGFVLDAAPADEEGCRCMVFRP